MSEVRDVLARLREERAAWEALFAGLAPEQITMPLPPSGWSVKDVVAHLWSWQLVSRARLEAALEDRVPVFPPAPEGLDLDTENDLDAINAWTYARDRDVPWERVLADWRAGYDGVLDLAEQIPEADLTASGRFAWMREYRLVDVLANTLRHHRDGHRGRLVERLRAVGIDA